MIHYSRAPIEVDESVNYIEYYHGTITTADKHPVTFDSGWTPIETPRVHAIFGKQVFLPEWDLDTDSLEYFIQRGEHSMRLEPRKSIRLTWPPDEYQVCQHLSFTVTFPPPGLKRKNMTSSWYRTMTLEQAIRGLADDIAAHNPIDALAFLAHLAEKKTRYEGV